MVNNDYYSLYHGKSFFGEYPTLQEALEITASEAPSSPCFRAANGKPEMMTFQEVHEAVRRIGSYLIEQGIGKGDRIALDGANSIRWALVYLSASYAGAVIVPLDSQMEKEKLERLIPFAGARMLFADSDVLEKISIEGLVTHDLQGIDALEPRSIHPRCGISENDPLSMLFTSGTTGNEKCVVLTHRNIISNAMMASDSYFMPLRRSDVLFALLPLHHAYCCTAVLIETILNGPCCFFGRGLVPSKIMADMKAGNVTFMMGIPLIYNKFLGGVMKKVREKGLLPYAAFRFLMAVNGLSRRIFGMNNGRRWFRPALEALGMMNLRVAICGAGPLSPATFRAYQQLGIDFVQGYGLTETSPILTLNPVSRFKVHSVGKFFDAIDYRIHEPDLVGIGEVVVKGPNCCKGYYNDPAATAALFTDDGYLKTGDIGQIDRDGYLYLMGRAKNIIVTEGGKNVYPEEIEELFQLYPEVAQVLVRGFVANKTTKSEEIEALIYPASDHVEGMSDEQVQGRIGAIISEVNSRLPSYKKIVRFSLLDEPMSMTTTRKIQRSKVSEALENIIRVI